jgi:hypothetical protein
VFEILDVDPATLSGADLNGRLLAAHQARVRLDAAECRYLADWDARQVWAADGALSGAAWLRNRHGVASRPMRERLRVARRLRLMPLTAAAFEAGALAYEKVRLLANARTDATAEVFDRDEHVLVDSGITLDTDQFSHVMRYWRAMADAAGFSDDANSQHRRRRAWFSETLDGMIKIDALLDPETGRIVKQVLEEILDELSRADRRDTANGVGVPERNIQQRVADALAEMARRAATTNPNTPRKPRTEMMVLLPTDNHDHATGQHATGHDAARHHDGTGCDDLAGCDSGAGDEVAGCDGASGGDGATDLDAMNHHDDATGQSAADGRADAPGQGAAARETDATQHAGSAGRDDSTRGSPAGPSRSDRSGWAGWAGLFPASRRLPTLDNGMPITWDAAQRLACDANFRRVVINARSEILDLGRRTPNPSHPQRLAVTLRDGGCTFAGCDLPIGCCEVHHLAPYHRGSHTGGPTDLHNLTLACSRHHHLAHEGGFTMTRNPITGRIDTRRPDGTLIPTRPRPGLLHPHQQQPPDRDDPGNGQLPKAS